MKKRLFICCYKDAEWICAIVARDHTHAKKIFYKEWKDTEDDWYYQWIGIRVCLWKPKIDISKLPYGEIDSDWGYKHGIYCGEMGT